MSTAPGAISHDSHHLAILDSSSSSQPSRQRPSPSPYHPGGSHLPPGPPSASAGVGSMGFDHIASPHKGHAALPAFDHLASPTAPGPSHTGVTDSLSRSLSLGRAYTHHQPGHASSSQQQHYNQPNLSGHHQHLSSPGRGYPHGSASPASMSSPYTSQLLPSHHHHHQQQQQQQQQQLHSSYSVAPSASAESSRNAASGGGSLLPTHNYNTAPHSPLGQDYARAGSSSSGFIHHHSNNSAVTHQSPRNSLQRLSASAALHSSALDHRLSGNYGSAYGAAGRETSVEMDNVHAKRLSREASPGALSRQQEQLQSFVQGPSTSRLDTGSLPMAYSSGHHQQQQSSSSSAFQAERNPSGSSAYPLTGSRQPQGSSALHTASSSQRWEPSSGNLSRSASTRIRDDSRTTTVATAAAPSSVRETGLRKIRDVSELRPKVDLATAAISRRADPGGGFVSPLKAMTSYLHHTYHLVNPSFIYELSFNPRRVLTQPSKPMHNQGHDNEENDYILYVNDWLGNEEGNRYLILDILGKGTFGQVVKCQNMRTHEIVAVKVIKNKPAYYKQSIMEVTILENLNANWDPEDKHHILRLRDTFIHAEHLCLVFELLSSNLYELIKQNSYKGLSTSLVRVFTTQLLDALTVLNEARLIHCDLKPENILLRTLQAPSIKLVDFGSACHEKQTVYTYIQSRFYRSPEVLLGLPYNSSIDMWSLGCIAVELFLGLPLFPGTSEYNQIYRIVEMLGLPPQFMLEQGKQTQDFFNVFTDEYGRKSWRLKSREQYVKEHNVDEAPNKRYFAATTLPEIVKTYPLSRKSGKPADAQKEMANRASFVDFVSGLLNMDPHERWTPQQAKLHPFITGEKFVKAFKPPRLSPQTGITRSRSDAGSNANKHQFGGLPQTTTRQSGARAYHDAAAYNQHLAQQQAYNSAHVARQSQQQVTNNRYAQDQAKAQQQAQQQAQAHAQAQAQAQVQAQIQAQQAAQAHAAMAGYGGPLPALTSPLNAGASDVTNQAVTHRYGNRSRSNTQSMSGATAAALASAARSGLGVGLPLASAGSNTMMGGSVSPSAQDWERRQQQQQQQQQNGTGPSALDLLASPDSTWQQQQQQWASSRGQPSPYASPRQGSTSAQTPSRQYHSPQAGSTGFSVVVDGNSGHGHTDALQHQQPHRQSQLPNPHDRVTQPSPSMASAAAGRGVTAPPPVASSSRYTPVAAGTGTPYGSRIVAAGSSGGGGGSSGMPPTSSGNTLLPFDAFADLAQPSIAQLMPALKPQQYQPQQHHMQQQQQRHSMILPTTSAGAGVSGSAYMMPQQQQQRHGASPVLPGGFSHRQQQGLSQGQQYLGNSQQQPGGGLGFADDFSASTAAAMAAVQGQQQSSSRDKRYSHHP